MTLVCKSCSLLDARMNRTSSLLHSVRYLVFPNKVHSKSNSLLKLPRRFPDQLKFINLFGQNQTPNNIMKAADGGDIRQILVHGCTYSGRTPGRNSHMRSPRCVGCSEAGLGNLLRNGKSATALHDVIEIRTTRRGRRQRPCITTCGFPLTGPLL